MSEQTEKTPSRLQLETSTGFEASGIRVQAGFRTHEPEVLAGGPIEVESFVENTGPTPFYLAIGGDRASLRPSFFSFTATLEGMKTELDDPAASIPDLGGPASVIRVGAGASYFQALLVNDFVRLEKIGAVLASGEVRVLRIRCQRPLPLAVNEQQAFQTGPDAPSVDVSLAIHVQRDDAALEALVSRLAAEIRGDWTGVGSAERERAIAQLVALRHPIAIPFLQSLRDHPDPAVRMYVQRALTLLDAQ